MAQEGFVLSVLPLTVQAGAHHHLSLHVAPRLKPDQAVSPLGGFAMFREWAQAARDADWRIRLGSGAELAVTPLIEAIDADLWRRVFPEDTPVRGPRFDTFQGRELRSFDARQAHDLAVATALYGALMFPLDPPQLEPFIGDAEAPIRTLFRRFPDDATTTRLLDEGKADQLGPLGPALGVLHPVRRFYERKELARPHRPRPVPGRAEPALPPPAPDFHERVAHLADQPALLRRLGLVIDLVVDDLAALAAATRLRGEVTIGGVGVTRAVTPVVRLGDLLLTRPRSDDWQAGRLVLGRADRFSVLTLDTDGAALKLEAFFRSLPRMFAVADNNDPGSVAPPAQRAQGLTVVRRGKATALRGQLDAAQQLVRRGSPRFAPELATEDVTSGYRVEVWDDQVGRWFSLHARRATARLADDPEPPIYEDLREQGVVQTTAAVESPGVTNGPVYVHEAMFGWSGWSLSAPRPGPRAVFRDGDEDVTEEQPDPLAPVVVDTRVEPNSLPRLRFGRHYAFRAWTVDIAGNSPGDVKPPGPPVGAVAAPSKPAPTPLPEPDRPSGSVKVAERFPELAAIARSAASALVGEDLGLARFDESAEPVVARETELTGDESIDRFALHRLRERSAIRTSLSSRTAVAGATRRSVEDAVLVAEAPDRQTHLRRVTAIDAGIHVTLPEPVKVADQTVTPLTPFLRWDPVPPPAVVARHRFSQTESIRHLVIRSGVELDAAGHPTIVEPSAYIDSVEAIDPALARDWRETSERHLAAPKGSLELNELHGRFDAAIGQPGAAPALLGAAFRDDGTLFDRAIVDLADPTDTIAQPGISLETEPGVPTPVPDLDDVIGKDRGKPLEPGLYVVHDVDQLRLPYLPDPMATGVAFDMVGANVGSPLVGLYRVESTAVGFSGDWPEPQPLRLVLQTAAEVGATVSGNVVAIGLPPGHRLDIGLSSRLGRDNLSFFALWNLFPKALRDLDLMQRPAADGQLWALSPQEPISLVHAVPRPVQPPFLTTVAAIPQAGQTGAHLIALVDVHAPSTGRIDCEASWTEMLDDLAAPGPSTEERRAVACHAEIAADETLVIFGIDAATPEIPGLGKVRVHKGRHEFGDTRHRLINYAMRGSTRFREYFPEPLVDTVEKRSLVSEPKAVHVLSSAAPPPPVIRSVLPLFRWDETGDPGQPFGLRRRRRAGIRLYLERPWFQTGADEQLALLFPGAGGEPGYLSGWGADPIWLNKGPENSFVGLSVEDVYTSVGLDGVRGPDPRLSPPAPLPVADSRAGAGATLLGYRPEYNPERKLWFVDVAIEPAAAVWPFVRLAVARYQPFSLPGMQLSGIVRADFVPLPPERTLTVSRPDDRSVRVTVTGPIGLRATILAQNAASTGAVPPPLEDRSAEYSLGKNDFTNVVGQDRRMFAVLETRPAGIASDLVWKEVQRRELSVGGASAAGEWAWTGVIDLAAATELDTPGEPGTLRILVEEHEGIEADPIDADADRPLTREWRIVYADAVII